ncbi:hypothetical protein [Phreatobacter oligotrophus]|jgi:hypothetical protein|uniref:DUF1772 domain-containing protein n=1 Tax=Phreatobacter oligotrophus TaxID=1122261 RepID=A0A2T4Z2U5_9HYPH|nr:hypothetical protein [Phreatobacter oligotrophus]PTM55099.1 hypothetical protein C8P69_105252 [Phreatobacter oligotrophus]
MSLLSQTLPLLAALSLGLLAGALLAEDQLLVPYWRTLPADTFYALHPTFGPLLFRFYAPLTAAAPTAAVLAMLQALVFGGPFGLRTALAVAAALLALSLLAIYAVFFRAANDAFARHAVPAADLPEALSRWAAWHRARVYVVILAFALSLGALAA